MKKKRIPERWYQHYKSVSPLDELSDARLHALKTAIEEIADLESERNRLLEDTSLLETSLKDLQSCRKDNIKLLREKYGLEDALKKCWKRLVELTGGI